MSRWRKAFQAVGPGFVTGAADDDPAGIGTHSQVGARFGTGLLWTVPLTFPLMSAVQIMCARLGRTTGHGIADNLRRHHGAWIAWTASLLLITANLVNLAANLAAMGAAVALLLPGPAALYATLLAAGSVAAFILVRYHAYANVLRILVVSLFAYVLTVLVVDVPWAQALSDTFLPTLPQGSEAWGLVVAVFGTTISPYLFFWQASHEVEREHDQHEAPLRKAARRAPEATRRIRYDTLGGMFLSNLVAYFIILTTASTLHANGIQDIGTAEQAAEALRPIAGEFAFTVFALGIVGTGLLSIPILSGSAAIAVAELRDWRHGIDDRFGQARPFYVLVAGFVLLAVVATFLPFNPIDGLVFSAIVNGVVAVPLLVLMLLLGRRKDVMGSLTLPRTVQWLVGVTAVVMAAAAITMFATGV